MRIYLLSIVRLLFLLVIIDSCVAENAVSSKRDTDLVLGSYPLYSPELLKHRLQPLVDYLQNITGKQIKVKVSKSYQQFVIDAKAMHFDLVYSPAHFAARLYRKYDYQPLFSLGMFSANIVTLKKKSIRDLKDLAGKRIAIPNKSALVTQVAIRALQKKGIGEHDMTWIEKSTHDRALYTLFTNEADAAVVTGSLLRTLPIETAAKLYNVEDYSDLPADIFLVQKALLSTLSLTPQQIVDNFASSPQANEHSLRWKRKLGPLITNIEDIESLEALIPSNLVF